MRHCEPLIRTLSYAWRWTAAICWRSFDKNRRGFNDCNAFLDPIIAEEGGQLVAHDGKDAVD